MKNWRPISLLNADITILCKAIWNELKALLHTLISSVQTVHGENKFIGENCWVIFGITEISDWFNMDRFLGKYGYWKRFEAWFF